MNISKLEDYTTKYNELGSKMKLNFDGNEGVTGKYYSVVEKKEILR